ncbi:MAG: S8 family peptidase [Myxococcota bacterium]|nr:peptidase S8 [Deltaproteobacteria bacterium]MDQ3339758.1 S8 family peptidase [Myxococcota bacterium]
MADEPVTKPSGASRFLWLFVILALVLLWWYFRPQAQPDMTPADADAMAETDPDDILVDLKDGTKPDAIEQAFGIDLVLVDDSGIAAKTSFYRAHVDPARRDEILAALAKRSDVEIAEPDAHFMVSPDEFVQEAPAVDPSSPGYPNDPQFKFQWHMNQIGMKEAWKLADGNGVIVAVLDTGVGYGNHDKFHLLEDLEGVTFVKPYNFVGNNKNAYDDHGHGSHVTGTIAQVTNNGKGVTGIARNVQIMPLKVLSAGGSGSVGGIADAIRYAADNGAKVINMSLGGPYPSKALKKAVEYAHGKGVTVICAAGNESKSKVGYPAAYPGAVAVSATQYDEDITFYSNYGKDIDIAAPGGNTRVDQNGDGMNDGVLQNTIEIGNPKKSGYFGFMGTSMASPHVAGVAALVVGEGVTDPAMVEKVLKDSARKPGNGKKYSSDRYGAGIVDAPAAVKAARSQGGALQFAFGLLLAGAVAASVRRKGVKLGLTYLAGTVLGASGLFFLPYIAPEISNLPVIYTLTHGVPSWDLSVLGPMGHGNMLFFSALIPLALLAVGYGVPKLRAPLAGLSVGIAAHLAVFAVVPFASVQVPAVFGIGTLWLAINAAICVGLARLALRR